MNKPAVFLIVLLLASFVLLGIPSCYAKSVKWYFRSDYMLDETNTSTSSYTLVTRDGWDHVGFLGVRVYVNSTELTNGVSAVVSRSSAGSGLQTSQLQVSRDLIVGSSVVVVKVYMRLGTDDDWILKAEFTTDKLFFRYVNGNWTFCFYTSLQEVAISDILYSKWYFYFGGSYASRIEGVDLIEPTVQDWMYYNLRVGNFIGFIVYPYVNLIGNMFYGLIVLLVCMPLYIRYRNTTVILFIITLLGGAGGMISLLIPESGLGLAWLIFVLGLAGLIYKVFR
ncbi:MAG: hypothetical protein QW175_01705 [Candidatus Bathyarchaeia archaeon]